MKEVRNFQKKICFFNIEELGLQIVYWLQIVTYSLITMDELSEVKVKWC